jgi:hypothetical protein
MTYLNEANSTSVSLLRSGAVELGVNSHQMDLSVTRPNIIHLASEGQRELFFMGEINNQQVYFHLIIDANGKTKLSYLPIDLPKEKEEGPFKVNSQVSVDDKTNEVNRLKWQVVDSSNNQPVVAVDSTESSTTTKLYLRNENNTSVFSVSGNVKTPTDDELSAGPVGVNYEGKNETTTLRLGATVDPNNDQLSPNLQGGVTHKLHPLVTTSAGLERTIDEDINSKGGVKLGNENLSLTLSAEAENELLKKQAATLRGSHGIYSGELGITETERGETLKGKAGVQVTDSTSVSGNYVLDPSYTQYGVGADYKGKFEEGSYRVGCEANLKVLENDSYTLTPKVRFERSSQKERHKVSCEAGPVFTDDGLMAIQMKTQYDYKIADSTSVGVYVQGPSYRDGRREPNNVTVGVQGKTRT